MENLRAFPLFSPLFTSFQTIYTSTRPLSEAGILLQERKTRDFGVLNSEVGPLASRDHKRLAQSRPRVYVPPSISPGISQQCGLGVDTGKSLLSDHFHCSHRLSHAILSHRLSHVQHRTPFLFGPFSPFPPLFFLGPARSSSSLAQRMAEVPADTVKVVATGAASAHRQLVVSHGSTVCESVAIGPAMKLTSKGLIDFGLD